MSLRALYLFGVLLALGVQAGVVTAAWRRRHVAGWLGLGLLATSCAAWTLTVALIAVATPTAARALLSVKFLTLGLASVSTFLFVLGQTGRLTRLRPWQVSAALVLPISTWILSWRDGSGVIQSAGFAVTNGITHLATISFGSLYWVELAYHYGLLVASMAVLLVYIERGRGVALLVGVLSSALANVLLITGVASRVYDPMPFGLAVGAVAMWWGGFIHSLDLAPIARHALVDALDDGILIVDGQGRVVDVNTRMAARLAIDAGRLVGRTLGDGTVPNRRVEAALLKAAAQPVSQSGATAAARQTVALDGATFDVQTLAVGAAGTRVLVMQDVTERQRWADEQATLIRELQHALGEVKTLSGLLPICAGCKKIRDKLGEWQQMEVYIRERTDAEFSHGMCPECSAQWYAELDAPPSS